MTNEPDNPYAPPQSQVLPEAAMARRTPRAVKWARFLLGFLTVWIITYNTVAIARDGLWPVVKGLSIWDFDLLIIIGFGMSLWGRNKVAYFGMVGGLGVLTLNRTLWIGSIWMTSNVLDSSAVIERFSELLVVYGLSYLFYRITFGRPSRVYYGMVKLD